MLRKLAHSWWWELEKRLCGLEVGWAEVIRQTVSFLLVCVCLWGGEWASWAYSGIKYCSSSKILVTLIFHDHLHYCEIFLPVSLYLLFLTKRPLHLVFYKAAAVVLNRISVLHLIWFSHIIICVVTKQMRDETTRKVNKWPVTKATLRFPLLKFAGSSCKSIII